ncbi:MAG: phytanoyl-CoA dioxygenase family protein, partial [Candidatus Poribacteria bacterium]|nr:phytanoyl-CoA dioxygenase family protein [Candidatus Poribacteria bacterium]
EIIDMEAKRLQSEGKLANTFAESPFGTRLARIRESNLDAAVELIRTIMGRGGGGYSGPAMFQMLTHPPLLSCVESLVGPTIIGSSVYRIRPKLPNWERGEVPWHQDSGYFLPHCDGHLILTCWIPLIDATRENGCLYAMPRAHKQGVFQHYTGGHGGYLEMPEDEFPYADPIPMEMQAGSVLFMTNLTPHASFENRSDLVRWSVDLRYQNAEAPNNVGESPESYTPEREAVTMACYPPEADFIIRDPDQPEREVRSAEEFHRIRERYQQGAAHHPGRGWTRHSERNPSS